MFDTESMVDTPTETTQDQPQESPVEQPVQQQQKDDEERNFRALREAKVKAERERDDAIAYINQMKSQQQPQQPEDDEDIVLGADELAEGKHLTKVQKKIKKLENQLKEYQQQSSVVTVETRLRSQYPDFDSVVSSTNIQSLAQQYPEIAATIDSSSDLYSKAVSAYTMIKKLGIIPDTSYDEDKIKAKVNAAKPRPLTSVSPQQGDSPLSHANAFANGLTPELQKQLRKEMEDSRNKF